MKTKILRNIFLSVGVLFTLTGLQAAGMNERVPNFSNTPLFPLQRAQALSMPSDSGYANQNTGNETKKALEATAAAKAAAGREARIRAPFDSPAPNALGTFITFDAPGAGTGRGQGTVPANVNAPGAITGYYVDANYVGHGFVRASDGTITTFDVPDAVNGTYPAGINPAGVIIGTFADVNFVGHGFQRATDGTISTFDVPGAFFLLSSINPAGVSIGTVLDVDFVPHGFVRTSDGTITTFDVPGAVNGTQAVGINPKGVITGIYTDASFVSHGFLRASDGTFTTFDPPPPGFMEPFAPFSFGPLLSITPQGVITGTYFEPIPGNPFGGNFRVFVRATDGTFTTFDAATYAPCCIWSFPSGMNPAGTITGSFNDGFTINHGFLRTSDGTITTFDVPGAGTGFNQGTAPLGITPEGVVMGLYRDANYVYHGFLGIP